MAIWLKQSTASQEVCLGPFVDSTDGKTAETGLTIANTDIVLWKMGGTTTGTKNSGGGTHMAGGLYSAVLDATDTGTLGGLVALVNVAGALPVRHEFQVLPANIYDSVIAGTDTLNADVTLWLGTAAATPTVAGVPEVDITHFNGTAGTFAAGRPEVNTTHAAGTAWNSGAIGASTLAADTLTAAKVAADVSTEFATTLLGTAVPGAFGAGTLGRVAGRSFPDVTAGGAGGLFIAGTNAATTITTGLTTTFTGNLTGSVGSVTGAVGSVTGAVGSVTGNVGGNVTGTVGAAASVTGNVGGNVTGSVGSVTGLTASNLDTTVSSRLAPTVAARTLDVSATGEAGVDWANVGTPGPLWH